MDLLRHLLSDTAFWVALSTILCFGFIGFKAWRPILDALDARSADIRQNLAEAEALRREAEAILEEYKAKSANALKEAEEIVKNAQARAVQLRRQMESEFAQALERQEAGARMRISRLENEAIDAVKSALIRSVLAQAGEAIAKDEDASDIAQSLEAIGKTLH